MCIKINYFNKLMAKSISFHNIIYTCSVDTYLLNNELPTRALEAIFFSKLYTINAQRSRVTIGSQLLVMLELSKEF